MQKRTVVRWDWCILKFTQLRSVIGVYAKHAPANRSKSSGFMLATGCSFRK